MKLEGKYIVNIKEDDLIVETFETHNIIVNSGLQRVADWLRFNIYEDNYFPSLKQIDTTGMTVTSAGFTNPSNAVDGSSSSYTGATIDSSSWDNDWWRIDFGENKKIMAIYVDWMEDDSNYGADYKFEYSTDGASWTDIPARFRPPQESNIRGKTLFFVNNGPPYDTITARYIRLNTKRGNDNETFSLYELKFYEDNFCLMGPGVMALGSGATTPPPSGGETSLKSLELSKAVVSAVQPSGYVTRFIMSLDGDEGNNVTFTEAGMMFCNNGYEIPASGNSPTMFSRGVFEPSGWRKNSGQTADVYYEISVENS